MTRDRALEYLRTPRELPIYADMLSPAMLGEFWLGQWISYYRFLSELPDDVDRELIALTTEKYPLRVRCRGMVALSMRSSEKGIRMAGEWIQSDDETQRYLGWWALLLCPTPDAIYPIVPPETMVELYRKETCSDVRQWIEQFFAQHKTRFAVDVLCDTLSDTTYPMLWRQCAASTLGAIGDVRAVDALIESHISPIDVVYALGELQDRRGAEYVIRNLWVPGAPVALARIGGERAIPALQNEMLQLDRGVVPDGIPYNAYFEYHPREVRVALLLLQSDDVRNELLDIVANPTNDSAYRELALRQLERLGIAPVLPRFLELYRSLMPTTMGVNCLEVAKHDPSSEITEAMKEHFAILRKIRSAGGCERSGLVGKTLLFVELKLQSALHERIGNEVFMLEAEP